jgi:predicted P-loop ATPase
MSQTLESGCCDSLDQGRQEESAAQQLPTNDEAASFSPAQPPAIPQQPQCPDMQAQDVMRAKITRKPATLLPQFEHIPAELTSLPQWVLWRYQLRGQRWTKVPCAVNGNTASSTDPESWAEFCHVRDIYRAGSFDGIGFVTSERDPYVLIDLDHVLDPNTGDIAAPWANKIIQVAQAENAYIETSPTGTGLHIIGRGPQGFAGTKRNDAEIYCRGRYFTITGVGYRRPPSDPLGDISGTIGLVDAHINWSDEPTVNLRGNAERQSKLASQDSALDFTDLSDEEILRIARKAKNRAKFCALFDFGEWDKTPFRYGSRSEADMALAGMLAFYCGPNPTQIERLMRQSKLARPKWDEHGTYLADTIAAALDGKTDFYRPRRIVTRGLQAPVAAWLRELRFDGNRVITDEENVRVALANDPALDDLVRFNEFSGEIILMRPVPSGKWLVADRETPRRWTDADSVALAVYLQREAMPRLARDRVEATLAYYARYHASFHPLRNYLLNLHWDGIPRVANWLSDYMGAGAPHDGEAQLPVYLAAVGQCFLISAVARVLQPGCQADCALVLEGPQGIYKSTALRTLASDEWFSDSLPADLHHKDAKDHIRGKWIIELPELAQFRRNEIETVKAFLTRRYEMFRPSYGRHEIVYPRQCVFAGSTNSTEYLVDTTGNRRFWCVKCGDIDLDSLKNDRDQLWAEAARLYRAGRLWHLTDDALEVSTHEASLRVQADPWTLLVANQAGYIINAAENGVSPGEVLRAMDVGTEHRHSSSAARVGTILRALGWKRLKRHHTRGWLYFPPPASHEA